MPKKPAKAKISYYRIHIKGKLEAGWEEWFEGCKIEESNGETIFVLPVPDQPALHGVLARIRDMGLELLQIEKLS
jgi:hypothetical protein